MLKDKLASFKQQQEKVQARTTSDAAARARVSSKSTPPITDTRIVPKVLKRENWKQDSEYYAKQLATKNLPIGAKIKKVIDLLSKERRALTPQDIETISLVDLTTNHELQESLKTNLKVSFDGIRYSYKAKHMLKGKDDLLRLIRDHKDGISMAEVKDAYEAVEADARELCNAQQVWILQNSDTQEDVVYPNDPRIQIKVDEDVKNVIRGVDLPRDLMDMEKELVKIGFKPAMPAVRQLASLTIQRDKNVPKKRRESKRTKYTNNHLPELMNMKMPGMG